MKKIIAASLMPVLITFSSYSFAAPAPVTVDGGKINFSGSIVAAPCAVDNSTDGQMVQLGQVPTNRFESKGDKSSAVPFTIKLTGCDLSTSDDPANPVNYASASITFSGPTAGTVTDLAVNAGGSGAVAAKNVAVQILQDEQAVNVDGSKATDTKKIIAGNNEIPFSAVYVSTGDNVIAGEANASVNFQVSYE